MFIQNEVIKLQLFLYSFNLVLSWITDHDDDDNSDHSRKIICITTLNLVEVYY